MTIMLHKDRRKATRAFNLTRFTDQNGRHVELRKNKLPRGKLWRRLHNIDHTFNANKAMDEIKHVVAEIHLELDKKMNEQGHDA